MSGNRPASPAPAGSATRAANRPTSCRPAAGVLVVLLLIGLVPVVSAGEIVYDETLYEESIELITCSQASGTGEVSPYYAYLYINQYSAKPEFRGAFMQVASSGISNWASLPDSAQTTGKLYKSDAAGTTSTYYGDVTYGYFKYKAGTTNYIQIWVEFAPDCAYSTITGNTCLRIVPDNSITFPRSVNYKANVDINHANVMGGVTTTKTNFKFAFGGIRYYSPYNYYALCSGNYYCNFMGEWQNRLVVTDNGNKADIDLYRDFPDVNKQSEFYVLFGDTQYYENSESNVNRYVMAENYPFTVSLKTTYGNWYNETFFAGQTGPDEPTPGPANTTVNIYVRSSQTGALLAGAHLLLEGAPGVDGWSDYYNGTLPSGSAEFSLPTTTEATPYQFRVTATYPGYTETVPLQYFNTFRSRNIIIEMEPAAVAPTDPENTFLVFYVRDTSANPLPGAVIEVDDQWLYTNNNGYARFEVLKNATYPYKVSKSGYMTIQGSANVESEGSYTVNVVLGPGTVPTYTPTPTLPGATPTPDHRTNEQKGQAVIDMIADNAEGIGALALICLLMGLLKLLAKW